MLQAARKPLRTTFPAVIVVMASWGSPLPAKEWKDLYQQTILSTLWQQQADESLTLSWQTFNMAADTIDQGLTALTKTGKTPALVTDIDDTIVNATAYFADFIGTNNRLTESLDFHWWQHQPAEHKPGALHFLNYAHSKGVEILYLTARTPIPEIYDYTFNLLDRLGVPGADREHIQISPGIQKSTFVRQWGTSENRELLLAMGDKFADLGFDVKTDPVLQKEWIANHPQEPGHKHLVLPNAAYGSWECLTHGHCSHSPDEEYRLRQQDAVNAARPFEKRPDEFLKQEPPYSGEESGQLLQWLLKSAEYPFITRQIYNRAERFWKNPIPEQGAAVVTDIDGTVVQNMEYIAHVFLHGLSTRPVELFQYWAALRLPPKAVPGAREFFNRVQEAGGEIFYVTNRQSKTRSGHDMRAITLHMLEAAGLPVPDNEHLLLIGDVKSASPKSKNSRFQAIQNGSMTGHSVNVVQWIGDRIEDLGLTSNDLQQASNHAPQGLLKEVGRSRFLLPFALHASGWLNRIYRHWYGNDFDAISLREKKLDRVNRLNRWTDNQRELSATIN